MHCLHVINAFIHESGRFVYLGVNLVAGAWLYSSEPAKESTSVGTTFGSLRVYCGRDAGLEYPASHAGAGYF